MAPIAARFFEKVKNYTEKLGEVEVLSNECIVHRPSEAMGINGLLYRMIGDNPILVRDGNIIKRLAHIEEHKHHLVLVTK